MRDPDAINEMIEKIEGPNGIKVAPQPTPDQAAQAQPADPLTPQQRLEAFGRELTALCQKYGVEPRPFIKSYNGGQQVADVEFVALQVK